MPMKNRVTLNLWTSIGILVSLAIYNLCANFIEYLRVFFESYTTVPVAAILMNLLFFWTLALLWIAYRHWRDVANQHAEFRDIFSSTGPEVMMVVNADKKIELCNPAVRRVFGYEEQDVVGCTTDFLYQDSGADERREREMTEGLRRIGFYMGEARGRAKDGTIVPLEVITARLKGRTSTVMIVRDVSERKDAEARLRKARDEAESANLAKDKALRELEANYARLQDLEKLRDNLIHMIVHDMKTPLHALSLDFELFRSGIETSSPEAEQRSMETMRSHIKRLDLMIQSVLDVSRLEDNKMPLNREPHDVERTARDAVDYLGAMRRGGDIRFDVGENLEPAVYDENVIQRVLVNLLVNAVKHAGEQPQITLRIRQADRGVLVEVADDGPGIAPEFTDKIFNKFAQAGRGMRAIGGSTGLGLTFCKMAVEAHGGGIGVRNGDNKGAIFWFTLPGRAGS